VAASCQPPEDEGLPRDPRSGPTLQRHARHLRIMHLVPACQPPRSPERGAERLGVRGLESPVGSPPRGLGRPALRRAYVAEQRPHKHKPAVRASSLRVCRVREGGIPPMPRGEEPRQALAGGRLEPLVCGRLPASVICGRLAVGAGPASSPSARLARRAPRSQLGIQRRYTRPRRPQTNGKAEAFVKTLLREWAYRFAYPPARIALAHSPATCAGTTGTDCTARSAAAPRSAASHGSVGPTPRCATRRLAFPTEVT
jgi:hypothetical protein